MTRKPEDYLGVSSIQSTKPPETKNGENDNEKENKGFIYLVKLYQINDAGKIPRIKGHTWPDLQAHQHCIQLHSV